MKASLTVLLLATGMTTSAHADNATVVARSGGAEVYGHVCQGCHMPAGQGAIGAGHYPKLAGDRALVSWQYVALTVLNGKKGMPAFGLPGIALEQEFFTAHLTDAQVCDVVNYVRSHFGNKWKGTVTVEQIGALPHPGIAAKH